MFAAGEVLPVNSMRFTFLDPHAQGFYPDWAQVARSTVAALRIAAARNLHGEQLVNLIGELSMRSDPFRAWWAAQDVYVHQHGTKRFHHPAIGDLDFEAFELPGDQTLWPNPNDEQLAGRTLRGNPPTRRRTGSRGGQRSR